MMKCVFLGSEARQHLIELAGGGRRRIVWRGGRLGEGRQGRLIAWIGETLLRTTCEIDSWVEQDIPAPGRPKKLAYPSRHSVRLLPCHLAKGFSDARVNTVNPDKIKDGL